MKIRLLLAAILLSLIITPLAPVIMVGAAPQEDTALEDSLDALCELGADNSESKDEDKRPAICDVESGQTANNNILVGPNGMITRTTQVAIWISGVLALILMIIAGLMFMFSSGNAESAGKAKRTMLYAVIGMIVAVSGQVIVTFVLEKL